MVIPNLFVNKRQKALPKVRRKSHTPFKVLPFSVSKSEAHVFLTSAGKVVHDVAPGLLDSMPRLSGSADILPNTWPSPSRDIWGFLKIELSSVETACLVMWSSCQGSIQVQRQW
jgi:hypothetical protein